jgi:hypothetical protein
VEQQFVHVPELALPGGGLGCGCRGEGVWVDLGEREMPEREPDTAGECCFDAFDFPVRLP